MPPASTSAHGVLEHGSTNSHGTLLPQIRDLNAFNQAFRALPLELREKVMAESLQTTTGKTPNLLAALRPDEALYNSALDIFVRVNTFVVSSRNSGESLRMPLAVWAKMTTMEVIYAPNFKHRDVGFCFQDFIEFTNSGFHFYTLFKIPNVHTLRLNIVSKKGFLPIDDGDATDAKCLLLLNFKVEHKLKKFSIVLTSYFVCDHCSKNWDVLVATLNKQFGVKALLNPIKADVMEVIWEAQKGHVLGENTLDEEISDEDSSDKESLGKEGLSEESLEEQIPEIVE